MIKHPMAQAADLSSETQEKIIEPVLWTVAGLAGMSVGFNPLWIWGFRFGITVIRALTDDKD
ncbi:MAG: hypothetical protein CL607_23780 [Anaerolineaceae bacterium]|nr:hypothetical protein [Anaerolineaceae bacterium]